jgi:hypothetical protein
LPNILRLIQAGDLDDQFQRFYLTWYQFVTLFDSQEVYHRSFFAYLVFNPEENEFGDDVNDGEMA